MMRRLSVRASETRTGAAPTRNPIAPAVAFACVLAAGAVVAHPMPTHAQPANDTESARERLASVARSGGWWVTSNAAYWSEGSGEPTEYAMAFVLEPTGLAMRGCMWGQTDSERSRPFWYFFHAWDATKAAVLGYQVAPSGAVAIGYEQPLEDGGTELVQELAIPGEALVRVRHINEHLHADTLRSRSFNGTETDWVPRRSYTWVWHATDEVSPCVSP